MVLHCLYGHVQFVFKPSDGYCSRLRLRGLPVYAPAFHKTERVPYLVAEVPALLHLRLVKEDIVARRGAEHHAQTDSVRTVFGDKVQRVRRVTQSLGHLAAELVAYDTGQIDIAERYVMHELVSCHDHPRHPEEQDVRTCNQVISRIVVCKILVRLRFWMPSLVCIEHGNRPEP